MPTTRIELRVFVAAPTEVSDDKATVRRVVEELNSIHGSHTEVVLRYVGWETDVHPGVGQDAQAVINDQIGDHYDIFVGLMWSRFGQATGRFGSGTEEECSRALERVKADPASVSLLFYFKDAAISPSKIDAEQLSAVTQFRAKLHSCGVLYDTYHSDGELASKLRQHLAAVSREWLIRVIQPRNLSDRIPAQSEVRVAEAFDSEDDFGLLDYIEKGNRAFANCAGSANRIGRIMNDRSGRVPGKAVKLEAAMKLPQSQRVSAARRILISIASDMDAISTVLEEETPVIEQNFNAGFSSFAASSKLMIGLEGTDTSDLISAIDAATVLQGVFVQSQESYGTLNATIVGLPQMERTTNRAKQRLSRAIANYLSILSRCQISLAAFSQTVASVLEELSKRATYPQESVPAISGSPLT